METPDTMHKLQLGIDEVMIRPYGVDVTNDGVITLVTETSTYVDNLNKFFKRRLQGFDMHHKDAKLDLWTCEGFQFLHNIKSIGDVLNEIFGKNVWHGKVLFNSGNWNAINLPKVFRGFKMGANCSFNWACFKVLKDELCTPVIPYNRSLDKTFLSLHAAARIDRAYIFDHLFKNHYDTSTAVFRHHHTKYYATLRDDYDINNHFNVVYDQMWEGTHPTLTSDDILKYCYDELGEKVPTHFVNVISETNFYEEMSNWFTEKTLLPMMHGQPFITCSTTGYYDLLHKFGFKTFSDYWDESFDNEPHHMTRLDKFLNTLDYIAETYNTPEKRQAAINDMRGILDHNRDRIQEFGETFKGMNEFSMIATGQLHRPIDD